MVICMLGLNVVYEKKILFESGGKMFFFDIKYV